MNEKKSIVVLIQSMSGGGAERVISLLSNELVNRNNDVTLIVTHQSLKSSNLSGIRNCIRLISLKDIVVESSQFIKRIRILKVRCIGKVKKVLSIFDNDLQLIALYQARNYDKIKWLKEYFWKNNNSIAIAFLNEPIFMSLIAKGNRSKIIISERNDPSRFANTKTTMSFIRKMYPKANAMVCQSPDAMQWYRENTKVKGQVIFNPIKPDLPERYVGERKKKIVNFCRISSQKNLTLLVNAFEIFSKDYPDYELYIYGDAVGNGAEGYIDSVKETISHLDCQERIHILPAKKDIHNLIKDYAMFVSSSDFEGMSNSMLEAMAIGLPTICTDCPAGGARAIIKDHENGILVPVNDAQALADAMKEVAGNPELAEKLSINGSKIREDLSVDKIVNQWMEIING